MQPDDIEGPLSAPPDSASDIHRLGSDWAKGGEAAPAPAPEPASAPEPVAEPTPRPAAPPEGSAPPAEGGAEPAEGGDEQWFIGRRGEEEFKIPADFLMPTKRGEEIEYVPIADVQSGVMKERDYRLKTAEVAQQRRTVAEEREMLDADRRRVEERMRILQEQEDRIYRALEDPEEETRLAEHIRRYRTDPEYKKLVDDSRDTREIRAENQHYRGTEQQRLAQEAINRINGWAEEFSANPAYAGVDPNRVLNIYGQRLVQAGQQPNPTGPYANVNRAALEAVFREEATLVSQVQKPLADTVATLQARIAELEAGAATGKHNRQTDHARRRAQAPRVSTTSTPPSAAPRERGKPVGDTLSDLAAANRDWARGG